jgi:prepilin-type N-terminal cleavage/methylation domain-containing protein
MKSTDGSPAGFTLIEVLVALTIVGLVLAVMAEIFSTGLTAHETASGAEEALALAEERLAVAAATLHSGTSEGMFAGRFTWRTTVAPYRDGSADSLDKPSALPRLYSVAVSVAWRDGHRSQQLSLTTLRLSPQQSSP